MATTAPRRVRLPCVRLTGWLLLVSALAACDAPLDRFEFAQEGAAGAAGAGEVGPADAGIDTGGGPQVPERWAADAEVGPRLDPAFADAGLDTPADAGRETPEAPPAEAPDDPLQCTGRLQLSAPRTGLACAACACGSCAPEVLRCTGGVDAAADALCGALLACVLANACVDDSCFCRGWRCGQAPCAAEYLAAGGSTSEQEIPRADAPFHRALEAASCLFAAAPGNPGEDGQGGRDEEDEPDDGGDGQGDDGQGDAGAEVPELPPAGACSAACGG